MHSHILGRPLGTVAFASVFIAALVLAADDHSSDVARYIAQDYGFTGPDNIAAGWTTIQLFNKGEDLHQIQFIKLPQGKTFHDFHAAILADPRRMPSWAQRRGGPNSIIPGDQATAIVNLEPGDYVLICGIPDRQGLPHVARGMLKAVRVVSAGNRQAEAPRADVIIGEMDFSFESPNPITPGTKVVRVINQGQQAHEVVLVQLAPGASTQNFIDAFRPGITDSPAGKPIGGMVGLEPGHEGFFRTDFVPGNYGLICFLPDLARGAPHFTRGMLLDIQVK